MFYLCLQVLQAVKISDYSSSDSGSDSSSSSGDTDPNQGMGSQPRFNSYDNDRPDVFGQRVTAEKSRLEIRNE